MVWKKAERFEEAWQRQVLDGTADESVAPLIETARKVEQLGRDVPPPPYRLALGRQRFLTEAAKLRSNASHRKERLERMRVLKVSSALVAFLMVAGLVLGVGSAAAASVPGEPLYDLKLGMEQVRMTLAVGSQAKAEATLDQLRERVSEFTDLAKAGEADEAVQARVQEALQTALKQSDQLQDKDRQKMLVKLDEALQQHERDLFQAGKEAAPGPQAQLENMVQLMAWVRQELQLHTGEAKGMDIGERMLLRDRDRASQQEDVDPESTDDVVTDEEVSPASSEEGKGGNPDAAGPQGTGNTDPAGEQYQPADNPADVPGPGEPPAEPGDFGPGPEAPPQAPAEDPGAYGPGPGATPEAKPGVYGPGPGQTQKPADTGSGTGSKPGAGVSPAAPTMTPSPEPQQGTGQGTSGTTAPKKP